MVLYIFYDCKLMVKMAPGSKVRVSKSPHKVTKGHKFITEEAVNIVAPIRRRWTAVLVYPEDGDPARPTLMGNQSNYGLLLIGHYKIKPLQCDLDFTLARVWRSEIPNLTLRDWRIKRVILAIFLLFR